MAKHFMIYYKKGTGTFIITEPNPWAKENQHLFLDYDFMTRFPTTNIIESLLINQYSFVRVVNNHNVSLIQNLNTDLNL